MATWNEMETRPPELIERFVRLLLPPSAHEHVLGDLAERYESPGAYVAEALRTLPFVIGSQIRRTTNFMALPIVAVLMMMGFGIGGRPTRAPAVVATVIALLAYMLRDAYRVVDLRHVWRQGIVDTLVVAMFLVAAQAVLALLRPEWMLSAASAASGGIVLVVLYLLRSQNPVPVKPHSMTAAGPMSLEELRTEVRQYAQHTRRAMAIEVGVGVAMAPLFAATAVFGKPSPARAGAVVAVLGILFVVWVIRRNLRWQAPLDLGFAETLAQYRARLERNHEWLRSLWWWYLLPLGAGPLIMLLGAAATRPMMQAAPPLGVLAVLWLFIALASRQAANGLRMRIDALAAVEQRQ